MKNNKNSQQRQEKEIQKVIRDARIQCLTSQIREGIYSPDPVQTAQAMLRRRRTI